MSHWYDRGGQLILKVPYKDKKRQGEMKDTTLREARELGLFPSVTTVLDLLSKPMLIRWKVDTALDQYMAFPQGGKKYAIDRMEQIGADAAELGTLIHQALSRGFKGWPKEQANERIAEIVEGFWDWYPTSGIDVEESEHTFVVPRIGIAGTVDIEGTYNGKPLIADIKTQDFTEARVGATDKEGRNIGPLFHEPEFPLQLAGYDSSLGHDRLRMSLLISRQVPGLIVPRIWQDNERWNKAWIHLFHFWQHKHNYYPGRLLEVVK